MDQARRSHWPGGLRNPGPESTTTFGFDPDTGDTTDVEFHPRVLN